MGCNTSKESVQPVEEEKEGGEMEQNEVNNKENKPASAETDKSAATPVTDTASEHDRENAAEVTAGGHDEQDKENPVAAVADPPTEADDEQDSRTTKLDEEEAATKIQAVFRGHQTRKEMKEADQEPTREQLEAEFRADDAELCKAASTIQATFRNHMKSKHDAEGGNKEAGENSKLQDKAAEEELDIDLTDPDLNKAATKIQASFRGHKVRKENDQDGPATQ